MNIVILDGHAANPNDFRGSLLRLLVLLQCTSAPSRKK